jgi:uncharacterized membrane protein YdjX (TVP38/TMEM64 family)
LIINPSSTYLPFYKYQESNRMNVPATQATAKAKIVKWLLLVAIIAGLAALWWSGALTYLSDISWIRARVEAAGWFGPLLFLLLVIMLFPRRPPVFE